MPRVKCRSELKGTTELTKSFGWDAADSFMQHDVQEFNRVLCDKLETKMKGTPVEGTINLLLEGKMKSFIRCMDIEFESSREESFYGFDSNKTMGRISFTFIKDPNQIRYPTQCQRLKNTQRIFWWLCSSWSFRRRQQISSRRTWPSGFLLFQPKSLLFSSKQYQSIQRAKKGVIFKKFPPVLHLQLKRFEYDMEKDVMVKINDRHEFPETIDLTEYLEESENQVSFPSWVSTSLCLKSLFVLLPLAPNLPPSWGFSTYRKFTWWSLLCIHPSWKRRVVV